MGGPVRMCLEDVYEMLRGTLLAGAIEMLPVW